MSFRTVAIIQARMGSSRLPGKVLQDIGGYPMLDLVVDRTKRANRLDEVVVATSEDPADDAIEAHCARVGTACIRGSHFDVLDRYYQAAMVFSAGAVVRITADCPLIDSTLVDEAVDALTGPQGSTASTSTASWAFDFVCNRLPPPWKRTYPIGLDVEVCTFEALEAAWISASAGSQREHVMPYLYAGVRFDGYSAPLAAGRSAHGFRIGVLNYREDFGRYRWTVDTPQDMEFARRVYEFFRGRTDFTWLEVLELLDLHPELRAINAGVVHKSATDVDERGRGVAPK